jgi:4-alpha-glucanotransferase
LPDYQRQNFWSYLKRAPGTSADAAPELLRLAWSSPAALAIAPLQDLLNLGSDARMNVPGRADGNWRWRVREDMLFSEAFQRLQDLTESSERLVAHETSVETQVVREASAQI